MLKKLQKFMMLCLAFVGISMNASAVDLQSTINFTSSTAAFDEGSLAATSSNAAASNFDGKHFNGIQFIPLQGTNAKYSPQFFLLSTSSAYYLNVLANNELGFKAPDGYYFNEIVFTYTGASYAGSSSFTVLSAGQYSLNGTTGTWSNTGSNPTTINTKDTRARRIASIRFTLVSAGGGGGLTPANYSVTVSNTIENGTVTADKTSGLKENDVVTLSATPASGYEFSAWDVKDASSNAITVTDNKFNMPASNVTVSASFVKSAPTDYPGKDGVYSSKVNVYELEMAARTLGIDVPDAASTSATATNNINGKSFNGIKFAGEKGNQGTTNYPCLRNYSGYQIQMTKGNVITMTAPENCWIKSVAFEYIGTNTVTDVDEYGVGSMNAAKTVWTAAAGKTPTEVKFTTASTMTVRIKKITFTIVGDNAEEDEEEETPEKTPKTYEITGPDNNGKAPGTVGALYTNFWVTVPEGASLFTAANTIKLNTPSGVLNCSSVYVNGANVRLGFGLDPDLENGSYTLTIPEGTFKHEDAEFVYANKAFTATWKVVVRVESYVQGKYGKGTFYSEVAMTMPANTKAYTGVVEGDKLMLTEIEGNVIPAQTAVVLKGSGGMFTAYNGGVSLAPGVENHLRGTAVDITDLDAVKPNMTDKIYVLGVGATNSGNVGFFEFTGSTLAANKAYLVLSPGAAANLRMEFPGEATSIKSVESTDNNRMMYNLNGQRVNASAKGIVIMNGKKVVK